MSDMLESEMTDHERLVKLTREYGELENMLIRLSAKVRRLEEKMALADGGQK